MIENYKIENGILYLYIDISNEFGRRNSLKKNNIKTTIKKFIKKNKIAFTGTLVALVFNGAVLGHINIGNNKTYTDNNRVLISELAHNLDFEEIKVNNDNNEVNFSYIYDIKEEEKETPKVTSTVKVTSPEKVKITPPKEVVREEKIVEETKEEVDIQEDTTIIDNSTYVTINRSNGSVTLEIEEYIKGVVAAEMPAEFHIEALKAQAVIARTYTQKALQKGKTLTDNESTQTYKSDDELKVLWGSSFNKYNDKIKSAVESTKGIYLTYNGEYIEAVYHSTSNGQTENAYEVWGNDFAYLISVESPYDTQNKSFYKEVKIDYQTLSTKLKEEITSNTDFNITEYTKSNRVKSILIDNKTYTGIEIRTLFGLRSTDFEIEKLDDGVIFKTKGYGHGVGMSQYGANGMAKNGSSFETILKHYYPNVILNYQ